MSVMDAFKNILPEELKNKAEQRLATCNSCDKYNKDTKRCLMCGCFMEVKVFLLNSQCPLKKW